MAMAEESGFRTVDGVLVPNAASLSEGFCAEQAPEGHQVFTANVSAERIPIVFRRLGREVPEPAFIILEMPCNLDVEERLRKSDQDPFHVEVHHLSCLTTPQGLAIFDEFQHVLTRDGYVRYGLGCQRSVDEVFVDAYKTFRIFAKAPEKYVAALRELGIPRVDSLRTAWDTFTAFQPGSKRRLEGCTPDVYDVIAALQARGMYQVGHRAG
jgi:hypothetical protein